MDWATIVGAAVVGFLLGQLSSRLAWARQFRHRWDLDQLRAHSGYLAHVDELDTLKRREQQVSEDLEDPDQVIEAATGQQPDDPGYASHKQGVVRYLKEERDEIWKDLAAVRREVEGAEAQLELLSDRRMWVAFKGLAIYAGEEGYRQRRKEYVARVRGDLQIQDWPRRPWWKRLRAKAKSKWRKWRKK